jgi:hypothetical protein
LERGKHNQSYKAIIGLPHLAMQRQSALSITTYGIE